MTHNSLFVINFHITSLWTTWELSVCRGPFYFEPSQILNIFLHIFYFFDYALPIYDADHTVMYSITKFHVICALFGLGRFISVGGTRKDWVCVTYFKYNTTFFCIRYGLQTCTHTPIVFPKGDPVPILKLWAPFSNVLGHSKGDRCWLTKVTPHDRHLLPQSD